MKMHRIVTYVFDFEEQPIEDVKAELQQMRHVSLRVGDVQTVDIGEWDDDHELNKTATTNETFDGYFA